MSLVLYFHPLASYCHKVLIALYDEGIPFRGEPIDLANPTDRAKLEALWPLVKFPVLHDEARDLVLPESSVIIEHLDAIAPAAPRLVPTDATRARECRLLDRIFDLYVQGPMQTIVTNRLRPEDQRDAYGVAQAERQLAVAYDLLEHRLRGRTWAAGDDFTMADCSAAPALFYAQKLLPFGPRRPTLAAYDDRLRARPSFARVLDEAQPYLKKFPG